MPTSADSARVQAEWKEAVARDGIFAYGTVVGEEPPDGQACPRCGGDVLWDGPLWDGPRRWTCPDCGARAAPDEQPGGRHA